jgi:hypothetical protein
MDTLRGVPEAIEADFGDSIVARDAALAALGSSVHGLGPPDLCWLQKARRAGLLDRGSEAQGYYHHVLGRDVSSGAAVAAYFALLTSRVEARSGLQGLWSGGDVAIQRGFFCCYDAIARLDVRCELCVPGGVVAGCVDASGQLHDASPQAFMQAQVCRARGARVWGCAWMCCVDDKWCSTWPTLATHRLVCTRTHATGVWLCARHAVRR